VNVAQKLELRSGILVFRLVIAEPSSTNCCMACYTIFSPITVCEKKEKRCEYSSEFPKVNLLWMLGWQ